MPHIRRTCLAFHSWKLDFSHGRTRRICKICGRWDFQIRPCPAQFGRDFMVCRVRRILHRIYNMITMWRKKFDLTGTCHMHEAASKQAFQAVAKFRKANRLKHHKRVWRKKQARLGKCQTYKHNRWTEPSSLMRRWDKKITRLRSLNSRGRPKLRDNGCVFLPGLGEVKPRTTMPEGRLVSFQMIDVTDKVTRWQKKGRAACRRRRQNCRT